MLAFAFQPKGGEAMKSTVTGTRAVWLLIPFALLLLSGGGGGSPAHAKHDGCDLGTVRGSYGYTVNGTNLAFGLVAAVGRVTADGHGNLSGTDTLSAAGTILRRTITGTYTITPACTGTFTFTDNFGQTVNVDYVALDGATELQFIQTDPGTVITGSARRQ
jgi:hypothetical protein